MAIIRPRGIVVLPVGARLHGLSLLSFRLVQLFPRRRRTTYSLCTTDVVPRRLDLRVPLLRPGWILGRPPRSSSSLFYAPTSSSTIVIYLLTRRSHTRGGSRVCMRCPDIMLEKYELTTPRLYADSDDENEMRLSKVAASEGDRGVIHRPGGGD